MYQPKDVFYAVVYDDSSAKKIDLIQKFTGYVNLTQDKKDWVASETPQLFRKLEDAQGALNLTKLKTTPSITTFLMTFRIVESGWVEDSPYDSRIEDARRVVSGMLHYKKLSLHFKKLGGKVLTILDASYVNENQNKAVKDLVKSSFRSQMRDLHRAAMADVLDGVEEEYDT